MPSMSKSTTPSLHPSELAGPCWVVLRTLGASCVVTAVVALSAATPSGQQPWQPALLSDGQPDVQGDWDPENTGTFDLTDPRAGGGRLDEILRERSGVKRVPKPSRVVDPPDGKIPYQPWAAARQQVLADHADTPTAPEHIDPQARCLPGGVPREMFHSQVRILQSPGYVVILYAQNHVYRIIPLDGRPHVGTHARLWMGDSRGHWEDTTLVVDVTNQNSKGRLDMVGNFASDAVHVVERFAFVDANTLNYRATIEDPTVYTRPWTIASRFVHGRRGQGEEYWEDACHEGERSADAMIIHPDADEKHAR
jgi:hypothetical protein